MAHLLTYPTPDAEAKKTAYVGMTIFVAGWTMMFGVIFFIYGAMRISAEAWPPLGLPLLPIALPTLNTVLMVASSLAFEWGLRSLRNGSQAKLSAGVVMAALLGVTFCAIQWKVGADLFAIGLTFDRGAYAAVFYAFGMLHAAHVVIGVIALLCIALLSTMGRYTETRHLGPRLWAVYWHFVGVLWIAIYGLVIVL